MPIVLLANPLDADDAQRIGLAEIRNYAVGERIVVDDFAAQTLIRVGYAVALADGVEVLLIGAGSPNASVGDDGQWYLDELTETLWGPKAGGVWPSDPIRPDRGVARFDIVDYHLIVTYTSGTIRDLGDIRGLRGIDAEIRVGTVQTGLPGTNATVQNSGTISKAVLDFIIPRGDKGEQGLRGPQGQGYGGGFATGGVSNGVIQTVITSPWGLRNDGTAYYNADGASAAEAALLMPDVLTGGFALYRPGGPLTTLWHDKVKELAGGVIDARAGKASGLAQLDSGGKVPLAQLPDNIGSGGGGGGGSKDQGIVTVDTATAGQLGIQITSNWGITDAGVVYYDSAGAVDAEAGLLIADPLNDGFAVFRPGGPWQPTGVVSVNGQTGVVTLDFATPAQLADSIIASRQRTIVSIGTSYTLSVADAGCWLTSSGSGAVTVTVPVNADAAIPVGTVIELAQTGAGAITVAPASGVLVTSLTGRYVSSGAFAVMRLTKTQANGWRLSGDVSDDSGWQALTLASGFSEASTGSVRYRVKAGIVYVQLNFAGTWNAGAIPCTLPAGARPSSVPVWFMAVQYGNVYNPVRIDTNGTVNLALGSGGAAGILITASFPLG